MRHALIAARHARRWTQQELAARVSVQKSAITKYEQGTRNPPPAILTALADLLHVPSGRLAENTPGSMQVRLPSLRRRRSLLSRPPAPVALPTQHLTPRAPEDRLVLLGMGRLRQKAHGLHISDTDLLACRSMGEVQRLAKRQYHRLAFREHPDQKRWREGTAGASDNSPQFRQLKQAYDWIIAQPAARLLRGWMFLGQSVEVLEHDVEETGIWGMHIEYH